MNQIINYLISAGILQAVFISTVVPSRLRSNKQSARFLVVMLLLSAIFSLVFLLMNVFQTWPSQLFVVLEVFPFVLAPLLYLHLETLLFNKQLKFKKYFLLFIPALIYFLYSLSMFRFSPDVFFNKLISGSFKGHWIISFSLKMTFLLLFFGFKIALLVKFRKEEVRVNSFQLNLYYVYTILFIYLLAIITSALFALDFVFQIKLFSFTGSHIGWVLLCLAAYLIAYFALFQPAPIKNIEPEKPVTNENKPQRMSKPELLKHRRSLDEIMLKDKLHLQTDINLHTLAQRLEISPTKLSWLINQTYGCNFYDYINSFRVKEFVRKVEQQEYKRQTLLALAYDAGFNSKTTFNKTFKKKYNCTPGEFIKTNAAT